MNLLICHNLLNQWFYKGWSPGSTRNLLKVQNFTAHPRPTEPEALRVGPSSLDVNNPAGDPDFTEVGKLLLFIAFGGITLQ